MTIKLLEEPCHVDDRSHRCGFGERRAGWFATRSDGSVSKLRSYLCLSSDDGSLLRIEYANKDARGIKPECNIRGGDSAASGKLDPPG